MTEDRGGQPPPPPAERPDLIGRRAGALEVRIEPGVSLGGVGAVVKHTSRFSREVVATMISLATAAFGVVAALAWNSAITGLFQHYYPQVQAAAIPSAQVVALFTYAVVVTLAGVIVIVLLGRLAARINAQPVEFKYPVAPRA